MINNYCRVWDIEYHLEILNVKKGVHIEVSSILQNLFSISNNIFELHFHIL
jgi:hypothetical protein